MVSAVRSKSRDGLVLAAGLSILLLITLASFRRIWEVDFFWQYETGRIVAEHGPPRVDTLSYVSAGRPWVEMRWMYCLLLYGWVQLAGYSGAVAAKWLVIVASFALVIASAPWRNAKGTVCTILPIAILASTQRFFVRPELASFLFFSLFLWVIARHRQGSVRILYALPVLQVFWSNLHTLFLLGPALVGLLLVTEAVRKRRVATIAIVLAGVCAACLATPYGVRGIALGMRLLGELHDPVFRQMASEFAGPFTFGQHYTAVVFYEVLLAICAVTAIVHARRLDLFGTGLLLAQLYLSLTSIRNLPLFCLAAIPFVITNAAGARVGRRILGFARPLALLAAIGLSLFYSWSLATDRFNVRQNDSNQFGAGLATHRFPEDATRFLHEHAVPGALFNTASEGSYLVAHGARVFIDPRLEVPDPAHLARYLRMMQDEGAWREAVAQYDFRTVMVDLASPFLRFLLDRRAWSLVHFDDVAAVFVRAGTDGSPPALGSPEVAARVTQLRQLLGPPEVRSLFSRVDSPLPYLRLADFLMRLGRADLAEPLARDALAAYPHVPGAHAVLGQILEARSDFEGALREYEAELRIWPANPRVRRQAGILQFKAGRAQLALASLQASVKDIPADAQAWAVLTKIHADAGRTAEALECAKQAAELEPTRAEYVKNLGRLYGESGRVEEGIAELERGILLDPREGGAYGDVAEFYLRRGRRSEALAAVGRGLQESPGHPELLRMRERLTDSTTSAP